MTDSARDAASVIDLLTRYSFDLSGYTVDRLAEYWLQHYPSDWIRLAVVEALYQGRYKVVSVEQILSLWRRRGKPLYHFNPDFERIITPRFVRGRTVQPELVVLPPDLPTVALESALEGDPESDRALETPQPEVQLSPPIVVQMESSKPNVSRPAGAIQPFSVAGSPLPGEAIIRGFYAQVWEAEQAENLDESDLHESVLNESIEAIEPVPPPDDSNPVFFPESPNVEFKPSADPAIGELPIQPFQPSGDQKLGNSLESTPTQEFLGSPPIHQFVPTPPPSEFYAKLKAIVQNAAAKGSKTTEP
jgi:hypothetical protein